MKNISTSMRAHLDGELTSICTCWKIVRQDQEVFAFTDHDQPLNIDGITYKASTGFTRSAIASDATLSADNMEIDGFLEDESITEDDLRAGLFDYAAVEVFAVNWNDIGDGIIKLRKGFFGEIKLQPSGLFKVELRGLTQLFAMTVGEIYAPECRTDLGSDKCKVDLVPTAYVQGGFYNRNARVRLLFDELRYGHLVPLYNPSAEYDSGLMTRSYYWESLFPSQMRQVSGSRDDPEPYEGSYSFKFNDTQWYWQNFPLSRFPPNNRPSFADIDGLLSGAFSATMRAKMWLPTSGSTVEIGLCFLNSAGNRIDSPPSEFSVDMLDWDPEYLEFVGPELSEEWTEIELTADVPNGTRWIRVCVRSKAFGDIWGVTFVDDIQLTVTRNAFEPIHWHAILNNPGAEVSGILQTGNMPGWTHRTSELWQAPGNLNITPASGNYMFFPSGDEWWWQDVDVSEAPGVTYDEVDQEKYSVEFSIKTANTEPGHRARIGLRFFDASMNRIFPQPGFGSTDMARVVPQDAVTELRHSKELRKWEVRTLNVPIPPGTRIIRYCVYRDRDPDADILTRSIYFDDARAVIWENGYEQVERLASAENFELLAVRGGYTGLTPPNWSLLQDEGDTVDDGQVRWRLIQSYYVHVGVVDTVINRNRFTVSGIPAVPKRTRVNEYNVVVEENFPTSQFDFYRYGLLHFETGQNKGRRIEVKSFDHSTNTITTFLPFMRPIAPGDKFSIWVGCGKSVDECFRKFNNIINFRGEPEVPGQDQYFKIGGG